MRALFDRSAMLVVGLHAGLVLADPITFDNSTQFRENRGPNSVGGVPGDHTTVVVRNVIPNLTTSGSATNPAAAGSVPFVNLFVADVGFFNRSFAATFFNVGGAPGSTVTLQNKGDSRSVVVNSLAGVGLLPLVQNLTASGSPLAPTLTWDPVVTSTFYNQVRLSIYNDDTDQLLVTERLIGGPGTTSYNVPMGTLAPNSRYAFRLFLWDSTGPFNTLLNRSSTHLGVVTTSPPNVIGSGGLFLNTGAPLTLVPGSNSYPNMSVIVGSGSPGAARLPSGTTLQASFLVVGNGAFGGGASPGSFIVDGTSVVLDGTDALPPASGGFLNVARNGSNVSGYVEVINGGTIDLHANGFPVPGLNAGRDPTNFGNVNVDGPGSRIEVHGLVPESPILSDNGVVQAGRAGDGRINITRGGKVKNAAAGVTNIGRDAGSRGSVLVSGAGSRLDAGRLLNIGLAAGSEGLLRIENAGLVTAESTFVGSGGLIGGNGGTLQTVLTLNGVISPGSSPGVLTVDGDLIVDSGTLLMEALGPGAQTDRLNVTGAVTLGANAKLQVQLGYIPTSPLAFVTSGQPIAVDSGFAGPQVTALLGTEAQGLSGAAVSVVVGDREFVATVQVPPIDPNVDYDGDGVADGVDLCPGTSAATALVIGECATGATNAMVASGCKMSDAVRACELGATNHGKYVSCIADNATNWWRSGLVSPKQRGAIQACAAQYK